MGAVGKEPNFYGHYFSMTRYLQPKWHGDFLQIEEFANWAVDATTDIEGESLYARIYWYLTQSEAVDVNLFEDSNASWDTMRAGFQDLMERHPRSYWNMNNFAAFSIAARFQIWPAIDGSINWTFPRSGCSQAYALAVKDHS